MVDETAQPADAGGQEIDPRVLAAIERGAGRMGLAVNTVAIATVIGVLTEIAGALQDLVQLGKLDREAIGDPICDELHTLTEHIAALEERQALHGRQLEALRQSRDRTAEIVCDFENRIGQLEANLAAAVDTVQGVINGQGETGKLLVELTERVHKLEMVGKVNGLLGPGLVDLDVPPGG